VSVATGLGLGARVRSAPDRPIPDPRSLPEWRRICLERQLPRPRFPAGVAVPALACFWVLVALAALGVGVLGGTGTRSVPRAVVDSQKQFAGRIAGTLRASAAAAQADLGVLAERYASGPNRDPAALLATVVVDGSRWRGATVLDPARPAEQQVVATRGEAVPTVPAAGSVAALAAPGGGAAVAVSVPLPEGRVLAAVTSLALRTLRLNAAARQSLLVTDATGAVLAQQGTAVTGDEQATKLVKEAVGAAGRRTASRTGRPGRDAAAPAGRLLPVVVAAPIGTLGLSVVSVTYTGYVDGGSPTRGVRPAVGLLIVAVVVFLVLHLAVVRPVRRVLDRAKAVACGEHPVNGRVSRIAEARRLSVALEAVAAGIRRAPVRRIGRRGLPVTVVLLLAVGLVLGWAAAITDRYGGGAGAVPAQITVDARNDVDGVAVALRDTLVGGLAALRVVAATAPAAPPAAARAAGAAGAVPAAVPAPSPAASASASAGADGAADSDLERFRRPLFALLEPERMRTAYVVDGRGRPVIREGVEPRRLRAAPPKGDGVRLDRLTGPVPVIYAHVALPGGYALIGEYDVRRLADVLRRGNGRLRAVDAQLRIVLDTGGYVPFRVPAAEPVRRVATAALTDGADRDATAVASIQGSRMLLASATVGGDQELPALRWAIVAEQPVTALRLPDNELSRGTWLVAFLGLCAAVMLFCWYYLVVIRPLQRMVWAAERLAAGDVDTAISPARHDEVGAIAICLDISRQALAEGPQRLAGAIRLRGALFSPTVVMPEVVTQRPASRGNRRARG
jgi:hypothetical protein